MARPVAAAGGWITLSAAPSFFIPRISCPVHILRPVCTLKEKKESFHKTSPQRGVAGWLRNSFPDCILYI